MKNLVVLILIFCPNLIFCQVWKFQKSGNSFDGFVKAAAIQIDVEDDQQSMLAVVNKSDQLNLIWGTNEKNGLDKLSLRFLIPNDVSPKKVLIAFDDEQTNYFVNFSYSDKKIYIENAVKPDFKSFLSLLDIISYFKLKKTVHFRIVYENYNQDYNFPLKGFVAAINKTFICPTYKRAGNWTDASFELMYFQFKFGEVDNGNKNFSSIGPACIGYLEKKYGLYFFTQIKSIESKDDEKLPTLIFKNGQDEVVAEIPKEIYLKNYYYFSGKRKDYKNQKISKDTQTIELYYQAFEKYTNLITKTKISLESFSNLTKKDLILFYKAVINNKEFLDYMRIDESIYYYYDVKEYTFDVFVEAWGK
jgi:hypothetical protein